MQQTQAGKHLGYGDERAYERMREYLARFGERVLSSSETHWQHRDIITHSDVYHIRNSTVVLEGVRELEIDNRPHYRYMRFKVAAHSPSEERTILSDLESVLDVLEREKARVPELRVMW